MASLYRRGSQLMRFAGGSLARTPTGGGGGGTTLFGVTLPTKPQVSVDTTFPTVTGNTWTVTNTANNNAAGTGAGNRTGCGWQYAFDNCALGDEIVVTLGLTFTGSLNPPNKVTGSGYVLVRTSGLPGVTIPPIGVRATPSDAAGMPKILPLNTGEAEFVFQNSAHHYWFVGIEMANNPAFTNYGLVNIAGNVNAGFESLIPHHLMFDRCYIHGDPTGEAFRGFNVSGKYVGIIECSITDFCSKTGAFGGAGQDTQGILGVAGYGPMLVRNCYLTATGENIMLGGSNCADLSGNSIISDVEIVDCEFEKPAYMDDETKYVCKNLLELKLGKRVWVHHNKMHRMHVGGQLGFAMTLTVRDQHDTIGSPYFHNAQIADFLFEDNLVYDVLCFVSIVGSDDGNSVPPGNPEYDAIWTQPTSRVCIRNNLVRFQSTFNASGVTRVVWLLNASPVNPGSGFPPRPAGQDWIFDHNTFINDLGEAIQGSMPFTRGGTNVGARFAMVNNLFGATANGFPTPGNAGLIFALPDAFTGGYGTNNGFIDIAASGFGSGTFPSGNFFPGSIAAVQFTNYAGQVYSLGGGSPYKAQGLSGPGVSDGTDLGCDVSRLPT